MDKTYSGSIALTKMKCVVRNMTGKDKKPMKCIIIPVEANMLVAGKEDAYYMPIRIMTKEQTDKFGQNGFISQTVDTKVYKAASDEEKEEFKKLPILGNIKDFSAGGNDNSGTVDESPTVDENDDLPF